MGVLGPTLSSGEKDSGSLRGDVVDASGPGRRNKLLEEDGLVGVVEAVRRRRRGRESEEPKVG